MIGALVSLIKGVNFCGAFCTFPDKVRIRYSYENEAAKAIDSLRCSCEDGARGRRRSCLAWSWCRQARRIVGSSRRHMDGLRYSHCCRRYHPYLCFFCFSKTEQAEARRWVFREPLSMYVCSPRVPGGAARGCMYWYSRAAYNSQSATLLLTAAYHT